MGDRQRIRTECVFRTSSCLPLRHVPWPPPTTWKRTPSSPRNRLRFQTTRILKMYSPASQRRLVSRGTSTVAAVARTTAEVRHKSKTRGARRRAPYRHSHTPRRHNHRPHRHNKWSHHTNQRRRRTHRHRRVYHHHRPRYYDRSPRRRRTYRRTTKCCPKWNLMCRNGAPCAYSKTCSCKGTTSTVRKNSCETYYRYYARCKRHAWGSYKVSDCIRKSQHASFAMRSCQMYTTACNRQIRGCRL